MVINSQCFGFVSTLCLRTSIKNKLQHSLGSHSVIKRFELPATDLRKFYELTASLSSDSPELLSSLSVTAHHKAIPRGQSHGGHYLFCFSLFAGLGFFLNTEINCHLACFQVLVFKSLFCFVQKREREKKKKKEIAVMLLVCFGSKGRRIYKAKSASYLLLAFCLNAHISCC